MEWSAGGGFFAPDGKMAAYWSKKGEEGYAEGKWSVTGNEFCYSASWKNATKPLDEEFCWKMYHVGKKTYYEETKASDGRALKITPKSPPVSNGDKATKQGFDPKARVGAYLVSRAQEHGAILRAMPGDIVAFSPPLIISEREIDEILVCFGKALDDTWTMVKEKGLA